MQCYSHTMPQYCHTMLHDAIEHNRGGGGGMVNERLCKMGKTSIFLCETETSLVLLIARPRLRPQNHFAKILRLRDVQNHSENKTARLVKFDWNFARPLSFQRPFTTTNIVTENATTTRNREKSQEKLTLGSVTLIVLRVPILSIFVIYCEGLWFE